MAGSSGTGKHPILAYLKRIVGKPVGTIFSLTKPEIVVGRGQGCGVCIRDCNISRNHCSLNFSSSGWTITDNGGVNGTFLNGVKLQANAPAPLKDGMVIFLGPPEDSPCGFVFLGSVRSPATSENPGTSQVTSSPTFRLNNMHTSLKVRDRRQMMLSLNRGSGDADPTKIIKTDYIVPIRTVKAPDEPEKTYVCVLKPGGPSVPGHSISFECKGAIPHIYGRPTSKTTLTYILKSNKTSVPEEFEGSDCSISSLDSLRTRIRKKRKRESRDPSRNRSGPAADSSESDTCPHSGRRKGKKLNADEEENVSLESTNGAESVPTQEDSENNLSRDSESLLTKCQNESVEINLPKQRNKSEEDESTILYLKERLFKLQKHLLDASLELKNLNEKNREQKQLIEVLKGNEGISRDQLLKVLEDELCCNICTEILIKPTTLNCAHTFCEHCISVWKKKKKQCPMCREAISSETGIKVLENLINKAVEHLDNSYQTRRSEIIESRVQQNVHVKRKSKRARRRSSQIRIQRIANHFPMTVPAHMQRHTVQFPEIRTIEMDARDNQPQSSRAYPSGIEIQLNDGTDSSIEGPGFNGFERCTNCGRRHHYIYNCPS